MARKKKQESSDFETPDFTHHKALVVEDIKMLRKLSSKLTQSGVLNRKNEALENDSEVDSFFQEATDNAKYEKELNSEHYHEELETYVKEKELGQTEDFANPSLDGIDDYGRQMYDDTRSNQEQANVTPPAASGGSTLESLKLTFESHGINPFEEGVYNKHTPVNSTDNIAKKQQEKDEVEGLPEPDVETMNKYSKILAKAKVPNSGF